LAAVQSNTLQSYPAEMSLAALICGLGTLMSGAVALVAERRDMSVWAIGFDTRLFTVVYSVMTKLTKTFHRHWHLRFLSFS